MIINWFVTSVWKCPFHFATLATIIAAAVMLVPIPLPRQRHRDRHVLNGILKTDVSPMPDYDQRSV